MLPRGVDSNDISHRLPLRESLEDLSLISTSRIRRLRSGRFRWRKHPGSQSRIFVAPAGEPSSFFRLQRRSFIRHRSTHLLPCI